MKGIIYKATNTLNGKVYIGQTKQGLDKRRKEHEDHARFNNPNPFYADMREAGIDNIKWEVLEEIEAPGEGAEGIWNITPLLFKAERKHILLNKSYIKEFGYNIAQRPVEILPPAKRNKYSNVLLYELRTGKLIGEYQSLKAARYDYGPLNVYEKIVNIQKPKSSKIILPAKYQYAVFYKQPQKRIETCLRERIMLDIGGGRLVKLEISKEI